MTANTASVRRLERRKAKPKSKRIMSRFGDLVCIPQTGYFIYKTEEVKTASGLVIPGAYPGEKRAPSRTPWASQRHVVVDPGTGWYEPDGTISESPLRKGDEVIFVHGASPEYQPKDPHPMLPPGHSYADMRAVAIILRKPEDA